MTRRELDDEETSIYEGPAPGRAKKETKRGHGDGPKGETAAQAQARLEREKEEFRRRAIELATPTAITPDAPVPQAVPRVGSEPIRVISMKTPGSDEAAQQRQALEAKAHVVKLRAISELSGPGIQLPLGNLAPPRDPREARLRRARDYLIVGLAVIIVGCLVMLGVWYLAR